LQTLVVQTARQTQVAVVARVQVVLQLVIQVEQAVLEL
jgi:hypothetical protein